MNRCIVGGKPVRAAPEAPVDKRLARKDAPRLFRSNRPVVHDAVGAQGEPHERDPLSGDHLLAGFVPIGCEKFAPRQMRCGGLDPDRLDLRDATRVNPAGLRDIGGHHHLGLRRRKGEPGKMWRTTARACRYSPAHRAGPPSCKSQQAASGARPHSWPPEAEPRCEAPPRDPRLECRRRPIRTDAATRAAAPCTRP